MKNLILYIAVIILLVPPFIMGCINWIWKPNKKGFKKGSNWLHDKFGYGCWIDNLMEEIKN